MIYNSKRGRHVQRDKDRVPELVCRPEIKSWELNVEPIVMKVKIG